MTYYLKDPQSRVDYAMDWASDYLDGQTIAASLWQVDPDEADGIFVDAASHDLTRSAVTLSGGIPGHVYRITNRVTFSDGRRDDRSILLRVEDR